MFLFLFINYRPKKIKNKIDESNDLEVDILSTEVSKVSNELAAIMDDFVNITIGKKYAYKIKIDKTSHDPNGPNAFPIKIIDKQTNTEVKQLDCCTSRLSASKSSESVANIFDNFLTTKSSTTTTTTSKSKKLGIKSLKRKEKKKKKIKLLKILVIMLTTTPQKYQKRTIILLIIMNLLLLQKLVILLLLLSHL